jgi:Family of unknown function (DUF6427)
MITSLFRKSTPLNYTLVVILLLFCFFMSQLNDSNWANSLTIKMTNLSILIGMLFVVNFIVKKNGLTKNSSYTILFYLLLLLFFPSLFSDFKLLAANFFLIIAMRRLISLQSLKAPKEKVFDASLWIFVASLLHFWCILFILLVFISIIFHVSRDYRNWLLPFVAFFAIATIFVLSAMIFDITWISHFLEQRKMNFQLDYFTNNYQNIALSIYVVTALYFVFSMIFSVTNKPLILQASFKKMIFAFFIGIVVFLISPEKNSTILVFTFMPLSVMATSNIEYSQSKMYQEIVSALFIILGFFCFFSQL